MHKARAEQAVCFSTLTYLGICEGFLICDPCGGLSSSLLVLRLRHWFERLAPPAASTWRAAYRLHSSHPRLYNVSFALPAEYDRTYNFCTDPPQHQCTSRGPVGGRGSGICDVLVTLSQRRKTHSHCIEITASCTLSGSRANLVTRWRTSRLTLGISDRNRMRTLSFASRKGTMPSKILNIHFS